MPCEYCGRTIRHGDDPWCNTRCFRALLADLPRASRQCPNCNLTFFVPATWRQVPTYCSRSCSQSAYNRTHYRGKDNPRWRGGRSLSYGPGWREIKAQVRARDQVCRSCGKTAELNGRALDVHHLEPFRFSGDNSLENLITMCRSCHMRADDHGRAGSSRFLRVENAKRPTKREIRRLRQLIHEAERRARRRENQRTALAMNKQGASLREIARAVDVSHETVSRWLKGDYRVQEAPPRYRAHRARTHRRPLRARLLSCPSPSAR